MPPPPHSNNRKKVPNFPYRYLYIITKKVFTCEMGRKRYFDLRENMGVGGKWEREKKASAELNQEIKTGPRNNKSHNSLLFSAYYVRAEIIYYVDPSECFFLSLCFCPLALSFHTNFSTREPALLREKYMDLEKIISARITKFDVGHKKMHMRFPQPSHIKLLPALF